MFSQSFPSHLVGQLCDAMLDSIADLAASRMASDVRGLHTFVRDLSDSLFDALDHLLDALAGVALILVGQGAAKGHDVFRHLDGGAEYRC